jgi:Glycosyl transferase family 2
LEVIAFCGKTPRAGEGENCSYVVVRNERIRLERLLSYHRRIGVEHFLVVDNESTDGTSELLSNMQDLTCYSAVGSYKKARFGVNWVNFIASYSLRNRWVLILDADELLCILAWMSGLLWIFATISYPM